MALRPAGPEAVAEDAPCGAHPTGRDAHRVQILGVVPVTGARLTGEHPREVEAEDLAAGLRDRIGRQYARRPSRDQGRALRLGFGREVWHRDPGRWRLVPDGRQRGFELRQGRGVEVRVGIEDPSGARQPALVAAHELHLELQEPVDDLASRDDLDLVEADLDHGVPASQLPLAAQLADRDQLDQRRVAAQLEDQRPCIGSGPVAGCGTRVGRTLELFAPMRPGLRGSMRGRLDRHDRRRGGRSHACRESGAGKCSVCGVDIAVLDLRRPGPRRGHEPRDRDRRQIPLPGGQ
jgi:hypothetical protein